MDARGLYVPLAAVVLLAIIGISSATQLFVQPEYQRARARWERHHPRHYVLEASWFDGRGTTRQVRLEVRNDRVVAGLDRATGQALDPLQLLVAARYVSVDALFEHIATATRPPPQWPEQLARALPALAPWISPCLTPLPEVRYDPRLGYPAHLHQGVNQCSGPLLYQEQLHIDIERLQPLS